MQIIYKKGNLLEDDADILVNAVNGRGFMAGGIAKSFAEKHPKMLAEYINLCNGAAFNYCFTSFHPTEDDRVICNALTVNDQLHGEYLFVRGALWELKNFCLGTPATIAIPPLGCGIGGLNKTIIEKMIREIFEDTDTELRLYNFIGDNNATARL